MESFNFMCNRYFKIFLFNFFPPSSFHSQSVLHDVYNKCTDNVYLNLIVSMLSKWPWDLMHLETLIHDMKWGKRRRELTKGVRRMLLSESECALFAFGLVCGLWIVKVNVTTRFHNELTCDPPSPLLFYLCFPLFCNLLLYFVLHCIISHIPLTKW